MSDYEDASSPPVGYPPQGTPQDPADHPATNVPTATEHHWGTARMQGIADEVSAFKKLGDSMRKSLGKDPL